VTRASKLIVCAALVVALFCSYSGVRADEALQAEGFCSEVEHNVNVLADFTTTKCLPGSAAKKGVVDLLVISEQPIFAVANAKKLWLIVVVGAIGRIASDNPDIPLGEICVSDTNLLKKRKYFVFSASEAKRLQHQIYIGSLTIDGAYAQLSPKLREKTLPASPK
jgi:hypothetical protein